MRDAREQRKLNQLLGRDDAGSWRRRRGDARAVDQGAGRAGNHALAARDARRVAHQVIEVEGDPRAEPLAHPPDHLIILDVIAPPDAAIAEDAGGVVDRDDHRRIIARPRRRRGESRSADGERLGHQLQLAIAVVAMLGARGGMIGHQQFGECLDRPPDLVAFRKGLGVEGRGAEGGLEARLGGDDLATGHVGRDLAIAGRGQHALADVHRADPADGYRVHIFAVAKHRDLDADLRRRIEDRRARRHLDLPTVDRHLHHHGGLAHIIMPTLGTQSGRTQDSGLKTKKCVNAGVRERSYYRGPNCRVPGFHRSNLSTKSSGSES